MPLAEPIFRHPDLDFATIHVYEQGTIDDPVDTVGAALGMGRIVRESIARIRDGRPFLDTEHGPIHAYKDRRRTLPEAFDDEYFSHVQWAHLASGGAGGGMRWPNRKPHVLTPGMHRAQAALSAFLPLIDWPRFRRQPVDVEVEGAPDRLATFACADADQAVVYLLRRDTIGPDGTLRRDATPIATRLRVPGLTDGACRATVVDPQDGRVQAMIDVAPDGRVALAPFVSDAVIAIRRVQ
jgi:mannan endo-1,4-beta-mannosidase